MLAWLKCGDDRNISAFPFRLSKKTDPINLPAAAWENERQVKILWLWLQLRMKSWAWMCERPTRSSSAEWGWSVWVEVSFKEKGVAAGLCWTAALLANSLLFRRLSKTRSEDVGNNYRSSISNTTSRKQQSRKKQAENYILSSFLNICLAQMFENTASYKAWIWL